MASQLSDNEIRVLGALVEKENTTPEYYPLSVNAILNACNAWVPNRARGPFVAASAKAGG